MNCLSKLGGPLSCFLIPIAAHNLGIKRHILSKIKGLPDLVKILPNIWRNDLNIVANLDCALWVRNGKFLRLNDILQGKIVRVCMRRNVTGGAWISVFKPCTSNILVLLVYNMLNTENELDE